MQTTKLTELLDALGERGPVEQTPDGQWRVWCPAHHDTLGSLFVAPGDGRVLIHCHAGCDYLKVLAALGLGPADLFDERIGAEGDYIPRRPRTPPAADDLTYRAAAYALLLEALPLLDLERAELRRRGLTDEVIDRNQYRTLTPLRAMRAAEHLVSVLGTEAYRRVPGLVKDGLGNPTLTGRMGILIPVRDLAGRMIAAQIRTPDPSRKYVWLSSAEVSSGTVVHVPLGIAAGDTRPVRVTEGPLKADIALAREPEVAALGVGGLCAASDAFDALSQLKPVEVRSCFDADVWTAGREEQARQVRAFNDEAARRGHKVVLEWWDVRAGKGIDDLLVAGGRPRRVEQAEAA